MYPKWNKELYSYLYPSHIPILTIEIMTISVNLGNLDTMKWLHSNGCPWSSLTFEVAASLGNLDNIKWLKENGCPYDLEDLKRKLNKYNQEIRDFINILS